MAQAATVANVEASSASALSTAQQIVGLSEAGWKVIQTTRTVSSRYEYTSSVEVLEFDRHTGCPASATVISGYLNTDKDASGVWQQSRSVKTAKSDGDLLGNLKPVLPSGWQEMLKVVSGELVLTYQGEDHVIIGKSDLAKWITHYEFEEPDPNLLVATVWESVDAWRNEGPVFVEVETAHRDLDVGYLRFVLPVQIGQITKLLSDGSYSPKLYSEFHPAPGNC